MVTSRDVARAAGVSQSTVSRVFSGSPEISAATAERVNEVAASLGYNLNAVARDLVRRNSRTIALGGIGTDGSLSLSLFRRSSFYFYLDVLASIERVTTEHGYDLLLPSRDYIDPDDFVRNLRARQVAGVIMIPPQATDARVQALSEAGFPTVVIDAEAGGRTCARVQADNIEGMGRVTRHLLALGHRRIAFLGGPPTTIAGQERFLGWQSAMKEADVTIDAGLIRESDFDMTDAYHATMRLLNERRDFTALVASSDGMAIGALRALTGCGLRVPDDVSLTGFDDIDFCLFTQPPLTTVHQDRSAMAQAAVRCLVAIIQGEYDQGARITVPAQLIIRSSTGPPAAS